MNEIIRTPTEEERKDFIPIIDPKKKGKNAEERFIAELAIEAQKAAKKGLPFAERAAKDEFKDYYDRQKTLNIRKNGSLKIDEIKPLDMNWDKFCDLKNFEEVDTEERVDEHLTRTHPGLQVSIKQTRYKYKGYDNLYIMHEDGANALKRAKQRNKE